MTSIRHNHSVDALPSGVDHGDRVYLDAARDSILAVGWRRTTLTDVAKRAGVSRMTLYRRWPDMPGLLGDLMLREWGTLVAAELRADPSAPLGRRAIAEAVVRCTSAVRENALFRKIVEVDPELLLPYLFERRGRTQDLVLDALADVLGRAQADRDEPDGVRAGDPLTLATGVLLTLHGFLFSAPTMTGPTGTHRPDLAALDAELTRLIERYLAP
jgi:AcrR family transcriptional regulator